MRGDSRRETTIEVLPESPAREGSAATAGYESPPGLHRGAVPPAATAVRRVSTDVKRGGLTITQGRPRTKFNLGKRFKCIFLRGRLQNVLSRKVFCLRITRGSNPLSSLC